MSSATPITASVPPRATRFHGTPVSPPAVAPVVRRDVVKSCDIHAPDHAAEPGPAQGARDSTNMTGHAGRDRSGPVMRPANGGREMTGSTDIGPLVAVRQFVEG